MTTSEHAQRPHTSSRYSVRARMGWMLLALLPGVLAQVIWSGPDIVIRLLLACGFALSFEALMLTLRQQPLRPFLTDLSAPLTATLFVLILPPALPWWVLMTGMGAAIVIAKQAYGGLGNNLFNPAMVGAAVVLLAFPETVKLEVTATTPLGHSPLWIAAAYALGCAIVLWQRLIHWQLPAALLGTCLLFWLFTEMSSASNQTPALAATLILTAGFIASDPVTGCVTARGRIVFGAGTGLLIMLMATHPGGSYPQAAVFAVLLMNTVAPWIDRHIPQPSRTSSPAKQGAADEA